MDEIILVDIFDREMGTAEKIRAHNEPLLHRAFSVFMYYDGKMLIQKRARSKYHSGGLWANACCSHPRNNELLEEAVLRRMSEELGVLETRVSQLFSFVYMHKFGDKLYEFEYDHVFLCNYGGTVVPNPNEIDEIEWANLDELANRLREVPEQFAPWFIISAPRVLSHLMGICNHLTS